MLRSALIAPIPVLLERHAVNAGMRVAFRDGHRQVTYAELFARTGNIASHLVDMGVAAGDCVAVYLPSSVCWVEAVLAIVRAGAVAVPISFDATESELAYRLSDANCTAVFTLSAKKADIERIKLASPLTTRIILSDGAPKAPLRTLDEMAAAERDFRKIDSQKLARRGRAMFQVAATSPARGFQANPGS